MLTTILTTTAITAFIVMVTIMVYEHFRKEDEPICLDEEKVENPYVKCEDCACILDKATALKVKSNMMGGPFYFCHEHKPPYDEVSVPWGVDEPIKHYRLERIEVTREGKPVKK